MYNTSYKIVQTKKRNHSINKNNIHISLKSTQNILQNKSLAMIKN